MSCPYTLSSLSLNFPSLLIPVQMRFCAHCPIFHHWSSIRVPELRLYSCWANSQGTLLPTPAPAPIWPSSHQDSQISSGAINLTCRLNLCSPSLPLCDIMTSPGEFPVHLRFLKICAWEEVSLLLGDAGSCKSGKGRALTCLSR